MKFNPLGELFAQISERDIIRQQTKRNKSVIYGARSIGKQIGFLARHTFDWDIYSMKPSKSARQLERKLDRIAKKDIYYVKPALHPGTYKVMHKGIDRLRETKDDYGIVDYTRMKKGIRTRTIGGLKYTHLKENIKDKRKLLKDPAFKFRHAKDRDDLDRIRLAFKIRRF